MISKPVLRILVRGRHIDTGLLITAKDNLRAMLDPLSQNSDIGATLSVDKKLKSITISTRDGAPLPPRIKQDMQKFFEGYRGVRPVFESLAKGNGGTVQGKTYLKEEIEGYKRQIGDLSVQIDDLTAENQSLRVRLGELSSYENTLSQRDDEVKALRDQLERTTEEALNDISDQEQKYKADLARVESGHGAKLAEKQAESDARLKELLRQKDINRKIMKRYEGKLVLDADLSAEGVLDATMLEGFAKTAVAGTEALLAGLEDDISGAMREHSIASREEFYERLATGLMDVEELPDYASKRQDYEQAKELVKKPARFVRVDEARAAIADYEKFVVEHEKNRNITSKIRKNRDVYYYMTMREDATDYVMDVYMPLWHRSDSKNFSETEMRLVSVVMDAWNEVLDDTKGEGSFRRTQKKGVMSYEFRVPKLKAKKDKVTGLKDKFKRKIYENAEKGVLNSVGMRFNVAELAYERPPYREAEAAEIEVPKAGYGRPERIAGEEKPLSPAPEKPGALHAPEMPSGTRTAYRPKRHFKGENDEKFLALYKEFAGSARGNGIATPPTESFASAEMAARCAEVMLAIGKEGKTRDVLVDYFEKARPGWGLYDRGTTNVIDNTLRPLLKMGVVERAGRGMYRLK